MGYFQTFRSDGRPKPEQISQALIIRKPKRDKRAIQELIEKIKELHRSEKDFTWKMKLAQAGESLNCLLLKDNG